MLRKIFTKRNITIFIFALCLSMFQWVCFAATGDLDPTKINTLGDKIVRIFQIVGYWFFIIKCFIDVFKCVNGHDYHKIPSIVITYLMIYAILFVLPYGFNVIEDVFSTP